MGCFIFPFASCSSEAVEIKIEFRCDHFPWVKAVEGDLSNNYIPSNAFIHVRNYIYPTAIISSY